MKQEKTERGRGKTGAGMIPLEVAFPAPTNVSYRFNKTLSYRGGPRRRAEIRSRRGAGFSAAPCKQ